MQSNVLNMMFNGLSENMLSNMEYIYSAETKDCRPFHFYIPSVMPLIQHEPYYETSKHINSIGILNADECRVRFSGNAKSANGLLIDAGNLPNKISFDDGFICLFPGEEIDSATVLMRK